MRHRLLSTLLVAAALAGCEGNARMADDGPRFPEPDRPVSELGSNQFSTEDQRDSRGEASTVMELAEIAEGMTVADIGAGNGYYTVRLAERVGDDGRVLAQDIDGAALTRLARRIERYRLEILDAGMAIRTVEPDAPGWFYASAHEIADFGTPQSALTFRVSQAGKRVPWGVSRTATCSL